EPAGIRACVEAAERLDLRLCMHLAESLDEAEFTRTGQGRYREHLERLGVCDESIECSGTTPVGLAEECGVLSDRAVLAHCNYVTQEEIELLASRKVHVAYCPRTHAAFGHAPHPFRSMLEAGVNVCVGTDSLASNPSLSVLDEIRHIRRVHPDMDGHVLLEMATIRGARALGLDDQIGTLTTGKSADITVVPFDTLGPDDPVENILCSTMSPLATYVRGRRIDRPSSGSGPLELRE
ncbi:MAG: amidohydrolase family protein, partial [Planctomycetes bacterium]|nr:amidohydrolase family protein [Planctomycetota bacterium]